MHDVVGVPGGRGAVDVVERARGVKSAIWISSGCCLSSSVVTSAVERDSAAANRVTAWPRRMNSVVSRSTTCSIPP